MEDLIIPIPSSFVRRQLKLLGEKGAGESKLFVGSTKKKTTLIHFLIISLKKMNIFLEKVI